MTEHKVLLIAGGSGSIGSAVARLALDQGWKVAVQGRSEDKVHALVAGLSDAGVIDGFIADVWEDDAAETLIAEVAEHFGRIDAVVDCTATGALGTTGLFPDTAPEAFTDFLGATLGWFERLAHAAYGFLAQEGGTLIAFVSDAGIFAGGRQALTGAARAGTIGFVRNLAVEAARDGIRVHAVAPSIVEGSDSARRMGSERMASAALRAGLGLPRAQDIAPLVLFLCSDDASKITGQVISVNGGLNA
ncbi:MAG TPA: SDR family oxidoreductase [Novosphingobium sp.]|nr:SDR family oxidoreductase [Novosphingobium sp.]